MTAENGIEALAAVKGHHPDLVILDLVLPGMEGSEVILQMRSDKDLMRIPVIVITGAHMGSAKAEILSGFSIPAMSKPWQESELLDRVEGAFLGTTAFSR
jgi:CheY-like chemotaxis protein